MRRRSHGVSDMYRQFRSRHWQKVGTTLLGVGPERRIFDHGLERVTQHLNCAGRHAGRCGVGATDCCQRDKEFEHSLGVPLFDLFDDRRNTRKNGMPEVRILDNDPDFSFVEPRFELTVEERRCNYAGLRFAASHGDARLISVAGDDFPFCTEQRVLRARQVSMRPGVVRRASDDFVPLEVVERLDWRRVPDCMDGYICRRSSDVTEFCCIVTYTFRSQHLLQSNVLHGHGNHRPIARRNFIEVVCGIEPRRTGHVGNYKFWVAGYETTKMHGRELSIESVCTGRTVADNDPNGLAAEEFSGGGTVRSKDNGGKGAADCTSPVFNNATVGRHWRSSSAIQAIVFASL